MAKFNDVLAAKIFVLAWIKWFKERQLQRREEMLEMEPWMAKSGDKYL